MGLKDLSVLLGDTARRWYADNTSRLGAALAFYAVFAVAPVLLIAVAVAGLVFQEQAARTQAAREVEAVAGPDVAAAVAGMLRGAAAPGSGVVATVVSVVTLVLGASALFGELQGALNTIWGVKPRPGRGWRGVVKDRFWSFVVVLVIGLLLLALLAVSAVLAAVAAYVPGSVALWRALNWVVSLVLLTLLFAVIYKVLPDVRIDWEDVWVGAAVTAVLFVAGEQLIGLFLARSGLTSSYGAAASPLVILVWVYYSAQVLLFGAEFTAVYAGRRGKPRVAQANAEPLTAEERERRGMARHP